jgi:hypothetical protein
VGIVVRNVVVDGGGEVGYTFEDTATNRLGGYFPEPPFNKIEPRIRSGNKMEVKAGVPDKPSLDPWMLVGSIIIGDAVNIQLLRLPGQ